MMKRLLYTGVIVLLFAQVTGINAQPKYTCISGSATEDEISNKLSNQYMPVMGVWVWNPEHLLQNGYKQAINQADKNSPFNLLVTFLRFPDYEVVDELVHQQVKLASEYAMDRNIMLVPDLDIRAARRTFKKKYPEELQQMLRIRETPLTENDSVDVAIPSIDLNDHYTDGKITHHIALTGSLVRVCSYMSTQQGIVSESIRNITPECRLLCLSKDSVKVRIPSVGLKNKGQTHACLMVTFTHLYPDIFGPHLIEFQRSIIRQYADIRLAGVCKDEWGFPPYYPRFYRSGNHDFWYSKYAARAYAEKTGGRDLLNDCLLMAFGFKGKEKERQTAINHFMEMTLQKNSQLEGDFYQTVKDIFGPDAVVTVHSTWWPYPDLSEFRKNGLDWWASKRDWAQTDEVVPFAVRTSLCKKWGSPVWYNMYYKNDLAEQVWSSALAGGRIDYLPFQSLFDSKIMRAECRIRLLNYISNSPPDCPVAVIFGHAAAMNWAGPYYNDVGMELVDSLWKRGYRVDLIPTSEIENGSLSISQDGTISYGKQHYQAAVLYNPEFEKKSMADFFSRAEHGKTVLFRTGNWTMDFNGLPMDGNSLLPGSMIVMEDVKKALPVILESLKKLDIPCQEPANGILDNRYFGLRDFNHASCSPPAKGFYRLTDGTFIQVSGTHDISGDTIRGDFNIDGHAVTVDAIGVFAVRLDEEGKVMTLAAGSLKSVNTGDFSIKLNERIDIALWIDQQGKWQGVIQGGNGIVPEELEGITRNWIHIGLPVPPQ